MPDESATNAANDADNRPLDAPRGLVCIACGNVRLKVVYTRPRPNGEILRRRECSKCGQRITTWERRIGLDGEVQMYSDDVG